MLTHTGPAFCAGADLSGTPKPRSRRKETGLADVLEDIQDAPKPVVARIAGHCVGGGVGLAAACDISIADSAARFGFTEVRVGVAPAIISVVCLPKIRRADALELFLSGERISAARAAEVGLITRAVPAADLDAEVATVAGRLLAGGPSALAAAKRLVYTIPGMERKAAFARTTELSAVAVRLGRGGRGDGRVPGETAAFLGAARRPVLTGRGLTGRGLTAGHADRRAVLADPASQAAPLPAWLAGHPVRPASRRTRTRRWW